MEASLRGVAVEIAQWAGEQSGIELSPVARRSISHPYPDGMAFPGDATVACYSLDELFAEKTRALFERTRPRDLYDVAHLGERHGELRLDACRKLFREKCAAKGFVAPTAAALMAVVRGAEELRSEWANMLGHQLPALPDVEHVLSRVGSLVAWIDEPVMPVPVSVVRPPVPMRPGERTIAPRGGYYWGGGQRLEVVRFAGANLLMIAFDYNGKQRLAEPYSLRRKGTGNLLLYAWEDDETHIKAFDTAKMHSVTTTNVGFVPRYRVEFTGS